MSRLTTSLSAATATLPLDVTFHVVIRRMAEEVAHDGKLSIAEPVAFHVTGTLMTDAGPAAAVQVETANLAKPKYASSDL